MLAGAQQIMAGLHDVVIVVGAEQQKTMSPADGAEVLGAAGDYHAEKAKCTASSCSPSSSRQIATLYSERYGLSEKQLARVAFKSRLHARLNPLRRCATRR